MGGKLAVSLGGLSLTRRRFGYRIQGSYRRRVLGLAGQSFILNCRLGDTLCPFLFLQL